LVFRKLQPNKGCSSEPDRTAENKPFEPDLDNASVGKMNYITSLCISLYCISIISAQVSGIVVDAYSAQPIEGVNVTSEVLGASTNADGEFQLDVNERSIIKFSHIGYHTIELAAINEMVVILEEKVIDTKEIIVYAGLTDETLQRITSSVTVFTKRDIKENGSEHFQFLTDYIPNLNWAGGTSRPRYFQIRGVGERSHYFGEGPPNFSVGFVLDDIDLSGLGMAGILHDIKQVEIFKGPQSSVYGPNAMAGLIMMRSTAPQDSFEANLTATYGSYNHYRLGLVGNIKIIRGLSLRVSGLKNYSDGFRENVSKNITNSNKRDELLLRTKLKYQPNEKLVFVGTVMIADLDNGYDAWAPDNNQDFTTYSNDQGQDSQKSTAFSLRANLVLSNRVTLTSITSFSDTDLTHSYDGDWANDTYWYDNHNFNPEVEGWSYEFFDSNAKNRTSLMQELRVSIGSFIIGGYYKHLKEQDNASGYLFSGLATEGTGVYDFNVLAGYAQYAYYFSSVLRLIGNFRYETNKIIYNGTYLGYDAALPSVEFDLDHGMLGFKGALQYQDDQFTSYYLSFAQGYKSGGVNQQPFLGKKNRSFKPEYIQNMELGFKRMMDNYSNRLTVFIGNRRDQQVSVSSQQVSGDPTSFYYFSSNAGSGRLGGLEWDHDHVITSNVRLTASLGYLDTKVEEFSYQMDSTTIGIGGNRAAAMAPKLTGSFGFDWRDKSGLFARTDLTYKDNYYFSDSHNQISNSYFLINLSFGKTIDAATITFWARNIFDKRYAIRGFYFGLIPPDYPDELWLSYGDPRKIGLSFDYKL
jgi:outer membrane receptor protein involved in Fe transport